MMRASKWGCSNIRTIPDLLNGKGARSRKSCDRGIMRRSTRGASAVPRSIHGHGGRTFGSAMGRSGPVALWRAGREEGRLSMNLIQTLEAEQIAKFNATKTIPIPPRRHAAGRRQGRRGRAHPRAELRRACASPAPTRHGFELHGPQDQLRRGVERVFPALFAERRFDRGGAQGRRPPRQALLSARPHRQVGAHRRAPGYRPAKGEPAQG
jgi:hypothetical protein